MYNLCVALILSRPQNLTIYIPHPLKLNHTCLFVGNSFYSEQNFHVILNKGCDGLFDSFVVENVDGSYRKGIRLKANMEGEIARTDLKREGGWRKFRV